MAENIFLFVPNLIGYGRIVLALISFYYMRTDYVTATWCYLLSYLLDEFDGIAARTLNQETKFGEMLDLLTDLCASMCLLVTLSVLYPDYMFWFQLIMTIDMAGHWLFVHSSILKGISNHKLVDMSGNPILRIYYTSKPVLDVLVYGNELFYIMLYLLYFSEGPLIPVVSVGIFRLILLISAPVSLAKLAITLLHMVTAAQDMAIIDVSEREQKAKDRQG
ncbi:CDP-diacylglycerol--inositol 3-phosphatidyltransferase-like [Patiria miniata]|uniref:CDP-diacylglycerol--inositol 3-phosphatidyltransferase n=1 Tax=Patiria miniata TaxID=46514 RepID=A0A914A7U9_PATMI|nr:CDP-diacylglycerol--inositol 3-phosphatidyltransferase-like [Patiria miniata]